VLESQPNMLYLGTGRVSDHQTGGRMDDRIGRRFVWNYYHRVSRQLKVIETTDNWAYGTAGVAR
jgi:hypothetical protein